MENHPLVEGLGFKFSCDHFILMFSKISWIIKQISACWQLGLRVARLPLWDGPSRRACRPGLGRWGHEGTGQARAGVTLKTQEAVGPWR